MHITCPKCNTNFKMPILSDEIFEKKLRCSKCLHIWFYKNDQSPKINTDNINSNLNHKVDSINLPVIRPNKLKLINLSTSVFLLSCLFIILTMIWQNNLTICSSNNLYFDNIKISKLSDKLIVKYNLINDNNESIKSPLINIKIYDKQNYLLNSYIFKLPDDNIQAYSKIQFSTEFLDNQIYLIHKIILNLARN